MPSPFPGMDPYLEDPGLWPDVHTTFINIAREFITPQLRPKYYARIEERVYISDDQDPGRPYLVPDLRISEEPGRELLSAWRNGSAIQAAEPETLVTLLEEEIHEPHIEVVDRESRQVVTVIEMVSPSNKVPGSRGRDSYQKKRGEVMQSPSHWMEIDLLRLGTPSVPKLGPPYDYVVHLSRVERRPSGSVWRIFLPQSLPVVLVPLKSGDPDVFLDLQQVLTTAYDRAAYDATIDYTQPPKVPLSKEYAIWADELLRSKGLRQ